MRMNQLTKEGLDYLMDSYVNNYSELLIIPDEDNMYFFCDYIISNKVSKIPFKIIKKKPYIKKSILEGIIKMVGVLNLELEIPFFDSYDELLLTFKNKSKEQKCLKM
jgi:hypothetical protein